MNTDESRLLRFIANRANERTIRGEIPDLLEIADEALDDVSVIDSEQRAALAKSIRRRVEVRAAHTNSTQRQIKKRWGSVLTAFDECVAAAEELNASFVDNLVLEGSNEHEKAESHTRYYGVPAW